MFAACSSNEDKAKAAVDKYLRSNIDDTRGYEIVEYGPLKRVDSIALYADSYTVLTKDIHTKKDELLDLLFNLTYSMSYKGYENDPNFNELKNQENIALERLYALQEKLQAYVNGANQREGYVIYLKYRVSTDKEGLKLISGDFYLTPEFEVVGCQESGEGIKEKMDREIKIQRLIELVGDRLPAKEAKIVTEKIKAYK